MIPPARTSSNLNLGRLQELQDAMVAVRAASNTGRIFNHSAPMAVVVRGTPQQIAIAERVVKEGR